MPIKPVVLIHPQCSFALRGKSIMQTGFDSIGLLALSSYLAEKGFAVRIINFARALSSGHTPAQLLAMVADLDPLLIGISMNWVHLSVGALEIAAALREKHRDLPIILGGQHASLFAGEIMEGYHQFIDGVVIGEGEETLLEIARKTLEGEKPDGIPGFMTWAEGTTVYRSREIGIDMDSLPCFSYESSLPEAVPGTPARFLGALDTSRGGCRRECNYCLESKSLGRLGRPQPVHHGSDHLIEQIKIFSRDQRDSVTIQDQISSHGDSFIQEFIGKLIAENLRLRHLGIFVEPGSFSRDTYDLLEQAPADEIVLSFGIETGSPKVARNLNRCHDYDAILGELEYLKDKRYFSATWWMVGLPEEDEKDITQTKEMIKQTMNLGIYPQWVTPLILFPQTGLAMNCEKFKIRQLLTSFEDFKCFSTVARNEYGIYPELITHESAWQSASDTIRYLMEIKHLIADNYEMVEARNRSKTDYTSFVKFRSFSFL